MLQGIRSLCALFLSWGLALAAFAQDAPGCRDHPLLSRMPGFHIVRCGNREFESCTFGAPGRETRVEGRYTELLYELDEGAKEPSRIQIHRNFENALSKIGGTVVGRNDDGDLYLKVARDGQETWIRVNAYITSQYSLHIIERGAMAQAVVANAAAMGSGLKAEGRFAVYGITFETGKADLRPESEAVLAEIARLLKGQPALRLHVVGHTDNVAGLELNLKLSQARAEAVVQALVARHGIAAGRLRAQGVGPVCPVAANDTEEGRARNRRVELVRQ